MPTATLDLSGLLDGLAVGEWVAISHDRRVVLSHGFDVEVVANQAKEMGEKVPLIVRVHDPEYAWFL